LNSGSLLKFAANTHISKKETAMLAEAKEMCPTTTRRLAKEGALLVDVREVNEVQALAFDVPDVVNIPLAQLETRWNELPKDRELVMACLEGGRSLKATYFMQYHGYTQVSNLAGGILKWMQKGFPVIGKRAEMSAGVSACCAPATSSSTPSGCC
jgi:rhodanese-related sulfurtransferase